MTTIHLGLKNDDVSDWQQFLTDQGLNPGPVDGDFELGTEKATIAFQSAHSLTPDGVVGPQTVKAAIALGLKAAKKVAASTTDTPIDHIANVTVFQTADGSAVYYTAGLEVDADGALRAYKDGNQGLDFDQNGKDQHGNWCGILTDGNGQPIEQGPDDPHPGYYISTTSLQDMSRAKTDPLRYVDAENIPYIVLPGGNLGPAMLGDRALVINTLTGAKVAAIVGDAGPKHKLGEASMAVAAALLGPKSASPRNGGTEKLYIRYVVFPNTRGGEFPTSGSPTTITGSLVALESAVTPLTAQAGCQSALAA